MQYSYSLSVLAMYMDCDLIQYCCSLSVLAMYMDCDLIQYLLFTICVSHVYGL